MGRAGICGMYIFFQLLYRGGGINGLVAEWRIFLIRYLIADPATPSGVPTQASRPDLTESGFDIGHADAEARRSVVTTLRVPTS